MRVSLNLVTILMIIWIIFDPFFHCLLLLKNIVLLCLFVCWQNPIERKCIVKRFKWLNGKWTQIHRCPCCMPKPDAELCQAQSWLFHGLLGRHGPQACFYQNPMGGGCFGCLGLYSYQVAFFNSEPLFKCQLSLLHFSKHPSLLLAFLQVLKSNNYFIICGFNNFARWLRCSTRETYKSSLFSHCSMLGFMHHSFRLLWNTLKQGTSCIHLL